MCEDREKRQVMEAALWAGRLLLENGAEISRVEETIERICIYFGINSVHTFVLTNGIFISMGDEEDPVCMKVEHIPLRGTRLDKIVAVNQLSREIEEDCYTLSEVFGKLEKIQNLPESSVGTQILTCGCGSFFFCYVLGGTFTDGAAALISGILLYVYTIFVGRRYLSKITCSISGALLGTTVCIFFYQAGFGEHLNSIVIGTIMQMIPGVSAVNAIRDIADGDYISGAVRMMDALLVFFCVALGVAVAISVTGLGGSLL